MLFMEGTLINLPPVGSEALVDICPWNDETWMAWGEVTHAWHDCESCDRNATESPATKEDRTWALIKITRAMTEEENPRGWQSDGSWNGANVVAFRRRDRFNGINEWRAEFPANDLARELWGTDKAVYANPQCREDLKDEDMEPCIVCGERADMRGGYEGDRCMGCDGAVCNCECMHYHNDEGCEGEQDADPEELESEMNRHPNETDVDFEKREVGKQIEVWLQGLCFAKCLSLNDDGTANVMLNLNGVAVAVQEEDLSFLTVDLDQCIEQAHNRDEAAEDTVLDL
jgi:hypothetical protein